MYGYLITRFNGQFVKGVGKTPKTENAFNNFYHITQYITHFDVVLVPLRPFTLG